MKVYISGPISAALPSVVARNLQAFHAAEDALRALGFEPVNPAKNGLPPGASWEEHMRADLRMLIDCDAVALLPGYGGSRGASLEMNVAQQLGLQVRRLHEWGA